MGLMTFGEIVNARPTGTHMFDGELIDSCQAFLTDGAKSVAQKVPVLRMLNMAVGFEEDVVDEAAVLRYLAEDDDEREHRVTEANYGPGSAGIE